MVGRCLCTTPFSGTLHIRWFLRRGARKTDVESSEVAFSTNQNSWCIFPRHNCKQAVTQKKSRYRGKPEIQHDISTSTSKKNALQCTTHGRIDGYVSHCCYIDRHERFSSLLPHSTHTIRLVCPSMFRSKCSTPSTKELDSFGTTR